MKVSRWCLMITFLYAIGAASYLWIERRSGTVAYFMPSFSLIVLVLRYFAELKREKRQAQGIDPAEREPWYLRAWPNAQGALVYSILMAVFSLWHTDRFREWTPNRTNIVVSVLFALLYVIELIRGKRKG